MKLTAKEFNNSPASAFRAADKGEDVIITHDRFDGDFVLVSKSAVNQVPEWEPIEVYGKPIEAFAVEV